MPTVVRTATTEQPIMKTDSDALDAVAGAEARREARAGEDRPSSHRAASATTIIADARDALPAQQALARPAATSGEGSAKMRPAATLRISERIRSICAGEARSVSRGGQARRSAGRR